MQSFEQRVDAVRLPLFGNDRSGCWVWNGPQQSGRGDLLGGCCHSPGLDMGDYNGDGNGESLSFWAWFKGRTCRITQWNRCGM